MHKKVTNLNPDLPTESIKNISIYIFIHFYSWLNRMHH